MAKQKPKKKPMTLDDFAVAIQSDLARMATKDDLKDVATKADFREVKADVRELREDVKRITDAMVSKADLAETVRRELDASPFATERDLQKLHARVLLVEEKLGMNGGHRAA